MTLMLEILPVKIKTSLSCRRPRVSASFSLACRSSVMISRENGADNDLTFESDDDVIDEDNLQR